MLKVLFYGTPQFAVPTLQRLIDSPHEVVGVVSQPDKPAGRGRKLKAPPIKELALEHSLPVLQPQSVKTEEFLEQVNELKPDVAVVVAYGKILPKAILDAPKFGCLNIHGSLLPAYRGAAPIQWAIVNGETKTGITIMQMDEGLDSGPMIAKDEIPILEDDDSISIGNLLSLSGAELILQVLDKLEADGKLEMEAQDHDAATKAPLIKREMARIDWSKTHEEIICLVHGFQPWPLGFTTLHDKELKISAIEACDPAWVPSNALDDRVPVGAVVELLKGRGFVVRTGGEKGLVLVTRVKPEGKPEMGAFDFVNGGGIHLGDQLGK